ncbi:hypothetical protein ACNQGG_16785 [Flavobacterium sp. LB1P62]
MQNKFSRITVLLIIALAMSSCSLITVAHMKVKLMVTSLSL